MFESSLAERIEQQFNAQQTPPRISYEVALELQRLKHKEHIGVEDLAKLIYRDQALSARILQIVNSAAYRGTVQVSTLKEAVVRLGINRVASFSMLAAQMLTFRAKAPLIAERVTMLHARAFASATCAHRAAEVSVLDIDPEHAFLATLLKDVGALQILQLLEGLAHDRQDPIRLESKAVDAVLAEKHADIGYRLMLQWQLPSRYAIIARDHDTTPEENMTPLMAVVRLTDQLCQRACSERRHTQHDSSPHRGTESHLLGLSDAHLDMLEQLLHARLHNAKEVV